MPTWKGLAKPRDELFAVAMVPYESIGYAALKELLAAGTIQRVGKGIKGDPFRYSS
jgi:hypothetical protein